MEKNFNKIKKIGIVGAESTGKTALCEKLAKHFSANFTNEKSRDYLPSLQKKYTLEDIVKINQLQIEEEKIKLENSSNFLFCDTTAITNAVWSQFVFNTIPNEIIERVKTENVELYLLTNNEVEWEYDPLREHPFERDVIFETTKKILEQYQKKYVLISGKNIKRFENAINSIELHFLSKK